MADVTKSLNYKLAADALAKAGYKGTPVEWVAEQKAAELSLRQIAEKLTDETHVPVSHTTVANWLASVNTASA